MTFTNQGHALSTPFGALKLGVQFPHAKFIIQGHALSTPFGALKQGQDTVQIDANNGACPLNALRGTETRVSGRDR